MDKFRTDLKIIRQVQSGEVAYIVKDPVSLKYFRFGTLEVTVFKYLDGTRDHEEVARLVESETGRALTGAMVAGFMESLKKVNLLERSAAEKSLVLLERLRKERKLKADTGANGHDVLYMRFPLFDPDEFYNRLINRIRFFWTRRFFIFCLILFSFAATIILSNRETVSAGLAQLYSFGDKGVGDILMFIGVIFTVIFFHENGHGLTCKRHGGEVHEIGFMLIFFLPAFYANVTDAWTFESKAAKLWVTFAGAFVELIICSIASFVWFFSTPGYFTHDLAFHFMLVAGLSSILFNMNPLIKLDGYFALVDYLEIPNLAEDASKYLGAVVRKYIFRAPVHLPNYAPRMKRILLTYGALAFCYRIFMLTIIMLFFYRLLESSFPEAGVFIFPLVAYRLLRKKLKAAWNGIHHLWVDKKEVLMKPKSLAIIGPALAVALAIFFFLPLPYSYRAAFVIEPAQRLQVRAAAEGFVDRVAVKEGDLVRRGALLALLRDADLEQKRDALRSTIALLDRRIRLQRAQGATAESLADDRRREQLSQELAETEKRLAQLRLTAPADGVIVTRRVEDRAGVLLRPGDEFCEIAVTDAPRASVRVDDWDLQDVEINAPALLRLNAVPDRAIHGRVLSLAAASELHQRLSPASESEKRNEPGIFVVNASAVEPHVPAKKLSVREKAEAAAETATSPYEAPLTRFNVQIEIEAGAVEVKPGMSGEVKIYGRTRPLALTVWRSLRDWFRSKIWW
jgi:putative peptide zinc metalloprotease protein